MEASEQHRTGPSSRVAGGRPAHAGETLSAVGRLIERADALHLRAPELALVLGERAAALAEAAGADEQWIRAESLVVSSRVRLGERPGTVGRAVAALRAAEHAGYGDIAARLRIDLAVCARSLGVPLTGLAALRPVLTDPVVSPVHRAAALCHLVGCLGLIGRKAELDRVLVEADKLVLGDDSLGADTQLLVRALLRVGTAAHRRRHGDLTAAADAARTGLGFLEKLDNPADDGGLVRIRLVLLLVSTLLDRGDTEMAYEIAEPMLAEPVRAAGVAPMGWLRLAVATRIHLPAGAGEAATELVREAVASTERHGLAAVTARLWLELAQLQERFGQAEEAIACLYRSRAAEQLHARARRQACSVLAGEFGTGEPASVDLDEVLKAVPSRPVPMVADEPASPPASPVWSFGREEAAKPGPAWSFERPRVTADVAETAVMPAVRAEPAEPRGRREPVVVERRPEPRTPRPEPIEVRAEHRLGAAEVGPPGEVRSERRSGAAEIGAGSSRRAEPEFRSESVEVRSERHSAAAEVGSWSLRRPEPEYRPEPVEVRSERHSAAAEVGSWSSRRVEPEFRPEPVEVRSERRSEPEFRPERRVEPGFRSASVEAGSERRSEREFRPESVEVRSEPEFRPESAEGRSGRRAEPEFRSQPLEARSGRRAEPDDVRPGRRAEQEFRSESAEAGSEAGARRAEPERRVEASEARPASRRREAPAEAEPSDTGKTKFSWAALAEQRLRETAAERESAPPRVTPALPLAPEPAAEREPWEERREPQPSTRHDAEHGSVAARSVLDRLGISPSGGTGGGRRRAEDAEARAEEPARPEPELAPPPRPEDEPPSVPDYRDEAEPWLPRLRMPPSLEPMEDFGHWTPATAPFPESYARAIAEDEPPPDAGLADLLARALAEHQAGTASAAALVKQLGSQDTGRRNGHGRNGHGAEVPDSRRHGTPD
ncbi:hypothetical protein [Amycolatopsis australiensis]|uniref:Tetratricopeptide repeat-containing protein n=1 Tax=Amycolatopsis australiensis TaxID=546364 RepID=A0A1K1RKX2_9PSEU|nr:hypothetical protein [Amycolatopsis australiensis]SFW72728.1 hypothetical protein SAMN04489730_3496 [Amycolatopsis australiensis]